MNAMFVFFRKPRGKEDIIHLSVRSNLLHNNTPHKNDIKEFFLKERSNVNMHSDVRACSRASTIPSWIKARRFY